MLLRINGSVAVGRCMVIILLIGLFGSSAWGASISFSTASIKEASICSAVEPQTKAPVNKINVFSPGSPIVYCSIKYAWAPPGTKLKAQWIYVRGEQKGLNDYKIAETTMEIRDRGYAAASLTKPNKGWPRGEYAVKLLINDKEKKLVPFTVK